MNRPEQDLQRTIVEYLELAKPDCIWFHPPNGGRRSKTEAAILKAMGVKPGVPDLIFLWDIGCGGIELKAPDGTQSDKQREFEIECIRRGIPYMVASSLDQVVAILKRWEIPFLNELTGS